MRISGIRGIQSRQQKIKSTPHEQGLRMNYFVSVTNHEDKPVVQIRDDNDIPVRFPLTKLGCIEAGKYLRNQKQESWLCSSSVDFPKEVKKGFKYDVHELLYQGYGME